jgi:DNA-binding transcriptional ArsR family regulator
MALRSLDPLSAAFSALADPTRRAILARLALGETSVGELVRPFAISGPAISRHLRVLEGARLIERQTSAQWRICRLSPPGLRAADDWLSQYREFWEESLDRLAAVLEAPPVKAGRVAPSPRSRPKRQNRKPS